MSLYKFGLSAEDSIINEIDSKDIQNDLKEYYNTSEKALDKKIKKILKNPKEFNIIKKRYNVNDSELIEMLAVAFPHIFNTHLIKFLRREILKYD